MKTFKDYMFVALKGAAMGIAEVIPGVSGGTIAFITGIYDRLLDCIKAINKDNLLLLTKGKFKEFWIALDLTFLFTLLGGMILTILPASHIIPDLLENQPIPTWSFFFGLILVSAFIMTKELRDFNTLTGVSFFIGAAIAYYITIATPATTTDEYWFIFLSGAIAICALILPGISGSFILLLMGKYEVIIGSLKSFNLPIIITFAAGALIGLLSFSRFVSWLLKNYHNTAVALLTGFIMGSLNKIWPWKITTQFRLNSKGETVPFITENVSPFEYQGDAQLPLAIACMLIGGLLVWGIEKIAEKYVK